MYIIRKWIIRVVSKSGSVPAGSKLDPLAASFTSDILTIGGNSSMNE